MEEQKKVLWSIMEKVSEDDGFRSAVLKDARSAISKEFNIEVPERISIVVHENDANTVHLPLPAKPEVLSEGNLKSVSGGFSVNCYGCY